MPTWNFLGSMTSVGSPKLSPDVSLTADSVPVVDAVMVDERPISAIEVETVSAEVRHVEVGVSVVVHVVNPFSSLYQQRFDRVTTVKHSLIEPAQG